MTTEPDDTAIFASDPSRERAKELRCLYSVSDLMESPDLSVADVLAAVAERIPEGWQHPELCRARITVGELRRETEGFSRTPWVQRAPITVRGKLAGEIEVAYVQAPPGGANEPFLLEEQKLVHTIGRWLGRFVESRQPVEAGGETDADRSGARRSKPEWRIILDLLKETDSVLWRRMLRRLMNHLSKQGVPGVQRLIMQFDPAAYANRDRDSRGSNQPLPKRDVEVVNRVFEEIIRVASITLLPDDLTVLLKQWMRQDKFGFLALATEQGNLDLATLAEIVNRFCRSAQEGESALAPSDDLNARVALSRRFLTDRLSFIAAAKEYLNIHDFGRLLGRVVGPPRGTGKIGGKAAGLFLAEHILKRDGRGNPLIERVRVPHTWFVTSDGLFAFVDYNSLQDTQSVKYRSIEEVRQGYPYLEQIFKHSFFPHDMVTGLKIALDDLGDWPLIVRSSSLLEDNEGSAFSGKYRSLFLPNTGIEGGAAGRADRCHRRGLRLDIRSGSDSVQAGTGTDRLHGGDGRSHTEGRRNPGGHYSSPGFRRRCTEQQRVQMVAPNPPRRRDHKGRHRPGHPGRGPRGRRLPAPPLPRPAEPPRERRHGRGAALLAAIHGRAEPEDGTFRVAVGPDTHTRGRQIVPASRQDRLGTLPRQPSQAFTDHAAPGERRSGHHVRRADRRNRFRQADARDPQNAAGCSGLAGGRGVRARRQASVHPAVQAAERRRRRKARAVPTDIPARRKLFSAERYVTNAQVSAVKHVVFVDPLDYAVCRA
jgi:hypothetical protein